MTNRVPHAATPGKTGASRVGFLAASGGAALLALAFSASAAFGEFTESHRFGSGSLEVTNLIGQIELEPAAGDEFEVEITVRGADGTPENVRIEQERGSNARLDVVFPVDDEDRYVYPEFSRKRASLWFRAGRSRSLLGELLRSLSGRRVRIFRDGSGMEAWADMTIRVPAGAVLRVDHGAGDVLARNLAAEVEVDVMAGAIQAENLEGDVELGIGSGRLLARGLRGDLELDTGSGGVDLDGFVGGDLEIRTGSGTVEVADAGADAISVDTGSGSVRLRTIEADRLSVDTGSGGVEVESGALGAAAIDTGSGGVRLALVSMGDGDFEVDTGSGGISLLLPDDVSARFDIDVGSGSIDVDVPIERTLHRSRGEMRFVSGDGKARVELDTGAGGVRVARID